MSRTVLTALAAAVCAAGLTWGLTTQATAQQPTVMCTQVPQRPGQLDETFVANFMSEQISQGRARFNTVQGVSTVVCAW